MKTKILLISYLTAILCLFSSTANAQRRLCIVGDAARYGWAKENASPMSLDSESNSTFHYNGWLKSGNFKFILENTDDSWLPTWNKSDTVHISKRAVVSDSDDQFSIIHEGNYSVTIDTVGMTFSIEPLAETTPIIFNTVFLIGSATSAGWNIGEAIEMTKNISDPFEFSYSGSMVSGEFKFPVNRNWGWGQEFFMKESDSKMVLQNSPDVKWEITEAGNYDLKINVNTLSIDIRKSTTTLNNILDNSDKLLKNNVVTSSLILNSSESLNFKIYDIQGQICIEGTCNEGQINVCNLAKGIYILKSTINTEKFFKL